MLEIRTPTEVGEILRLSASKVIVLARRRELPFFVVDGRIRFDAGDLEDWVKARKIGSPPVQVKIVGETEGHVG